MYDGFRKYVCLRDVYYSECSMLTPYFTRYGLQMLEEAAP